MAPLGVSHPADPGRAYPDRMPNTMPGIGRIVWYRTDGRNGLVYDLPAIVTVTPDSHPGDYPGGERNPLPVPDEGCVHLTVFSPGGFGTIVAGSTAHADRLADPAGFVGAAGFTPGSGTYVELNVPHAGRQRITAPRTWRWPDGVD